MVPRQSGAIALLTVIIVTSVALVFVVSLAIMNLDYSLTSGSLLFNRELSTAVDGCLDSAIGDLRSSSSAVTLLNVNDIGPSSIDCQVDIATTGNKKFLRARASSTSAFYNTVVRATSTVDFSTNPITIEQYQTEVTSTATKAFALDSNTKLNSSGATDESIAIDGNYAYVSYRDAASSNKLSINKVNLSTLVVDATLSGITSADTKAMGSTVNQGYLYVFYYLDSTTDYLSILRVDLNNFASGGVTVLTNPKNSITDYIYANPIIAKGNYLYASFNHTATRYQSIWRIDTNNFTADGITVRTNITSSVACYYADLQFYGNDLVLACRGTATKTYLYKFDAITNFASATISSLVVSSLACSYGSFDISGPFAYVSCGFSTGYVTETSKVNMDTFTVSSRITMDTKNDRSWYSGSVISGDYLYIVGLDRNYDLGVIKVDLRDFTYDSDINAIVTANGSVRMAVAVSGGYLYIAHKDVANFVSLVKMDID